MAQMVARPDAFSSATGRGAQPTAAEQEITGVARCGSTPHPPVQVAVDRLHPEEGLGVHWAAP